MQQKTIDILSVKIISGNILLILMPINAHWWLHFLLTAQEHKSENLSLLPLSTETAKTIQGWIIVTSLSTQVLPLFHDRTQPKLNYIPNSRIYVPWTSKYIVVKTKPNDLWWPWTKTSKQNKTTVVMQSCLQNAALTNNTKINYKLI